MIVLINCVPLSALLYWEYLIQRAIGFQKPTKFMVLTFTILLQITVFIHYFFTMYQFWIYFIVIQDALSSLSFLAICYLFCKNSSKLLPKRKKWLKFLKIVGLISLALFILLAILSGILKDTTTADSCKTWLFVFLNFSSTCISAMFLVAGIRIQKKIRDYYPTTRYEQAIHHLNSNKSLRQLRLCIATFLVKIVYSNVYSISLLLWADDCS